MKKLLLIALLIVGCDDEDDITTQHTHYSTCVLAGQGVPICTEELSEYECYSYWIGAIYSTTHSCYEWNFTEAYECESEGSFDCDVVEWFTGGTFIPDE